MEKLFLTNCSWKPPAAHSLHCRPRILVLDLCRIGTVSIRASLARCGHKPDGMAEVSIERYCVW